MTAAAIIVAAGEGRRMGFDKLTALLRGKSVLQHSLDACLQTPSIGPVVVAAPEERFAALQWPASREVRRAEGGAERSDSVLHGLEALATPPELVAVHDGARPCVRPEMILSLIHI